MALTKPPLYRNSCDLRDICKLGNEWNAPLTAISGSLLDKSSSLRYFVTCFISSEPNHAWARHGFDCVSSALFRVSLYKSQEGQYDDRRSAAGGGTDS